MLDYGLDLSGVEREVALPDLVAEGDELDALVSAEADWSKPTPAVGWTIAHQIAHLAVRQERPNRGRCCWNDGGQVVPRLRRRSVRSIMRFLGTGRS
ncbi:mycothiol maleylpyruvate isomerase-like protein [Kribbella kalugense]|uniref:Mycothiol maleylpyruvate isomerase-like protein n=1 Tax=Kribbella kalugense TaxID=2512221 RepID=A0A4V3G7B1_9ACTN|nr:mycothiol maleylpyruvate isomerase-like protein [Kribbella kalugense]